jgi:hypothetical protein
MTYVRYDRCSTVKGKKGLMLTSVNNIKTFDIPIPATVDMYFLKPIPYSVLGGYGDQYLDTLYVSTFRYIIYNKCNHPPAESSLRRRGTTNSHTIAAESFSD